MASSEPEQPCNGTENVSRWIGPWSDLGDEKGEEDLSSYMNYTGKQSLCKDASIIPNKTSANGQSWIHETGKVYSENTVLFAILHGGVRVPSAQLSVNSLEAT